jgi:hypothetical protein
MAKVTREKFSKSRPVLKPADLNGASHVVVTIEEMEEITLDEQPKIVLRFEEFPEHNYFPNVTSIGHLIEGISDESDDWAGVQVPLEVVKTNNPTTKKATDALWVCAPEEWKGLIRQQSAKKSGKKTTARK